MNKLFVMNGGLVALSDDERYVRNLTEEELAEIARRCNAWEDMASAANSVMKERPVLESIIAEIHRRAEKEWANDGYDFEVTITADEYKALCEEEAAISALQTQPAKAQVPDEREAFEAWAMSTPTMYHPNLARHSELSHDYDDLHIQAAWDAWQARSTLTASPAPGSQLEDTEQ